MSERKMRTEEERFWSKVNWTDDLSTCWLWTANRNREGYGKFQISNPRRQVRAHRWSYASSIGLDIRDLTVEVVMHSCDTPSCVNPLHLIGGTHAENIADRDRKGRHVPNKPRAKLTENDVREIRKRVQAGNVKQDIAKDFGICPSSVSHVISGATWRNVR